MADPLQHKAGLTARIKGTFATVVFMDKTPVEVKARQLIPESQGFLIIIRQKRQAVTITPFPIRTQS